MIALHHRCFVAIMYTSWVLCKTTAFAQVRNLPSTHCAEVSGVAGQHKPLCRQSYAVQQCR